MRANLRLIACVSFAAVGLVAYLAAPTAAAPTRTLASYCSPSGDICFGVFSRNGVVLLRISAAAHYFSRYTLCVKGPGGGAAGIVRCGSFPVFRQSGSTWGSTVRHARQYPVVGPGVYRVTWKLNGRALGPTLRFRLPLRH
jgi:hypothetical protein